MNCNKEQNIRRFKKQQMNIENKAKPDNNTDCDIFALLFIIVGVGCVVSFFVSFWQSLFVVLCCLLLSMFFKTIEKN